MRNGGRVDSVYICTISQATTRNLYVHSVHVCIA